ncbi:hypothetical protein AB0958_20245 [Streptomyces sp. NPDC006655]|uniref:hypothetical protein n=1 Tax=Streptomyces sp. NPDC006655 TaxID=3156898 RepID=UPI0034570BEE
MTEKLPLKPLATPAVVPIMVERLLSGPRSMERHFTRHGAIVPDWAPGVRIVWLRDPRLIEQVLRNPGVEHNTTGRLLGRVMGSTVMGSTAMLNQLSGEKHHTASRLMMPTLRGDALSDSRAAIAAAEATVRACLSVDDPRLLHTWARAIARLRQTTVRPAAMACAAGMLPWWPTGHRAWNACLHLVREEVARLPRHPLLQQPGSSSAPRAHHTSGTSWSMRHPRRLTALPTQTRSSVKHCVYDRRSQPSPGCCASPATLADTTYRPGHTP